MSDSNSAPSANDRSSYCDRHPWLVFVVPLVVYLLSGTLESALPEAEQAPPPALSQNQKPAEQPTPDASSPDTGWAGMTREAYPLIYALRLLLTLGAMILALPGYREIPCRVSLLAIGVGTVGIVVWVGLSVWQIEQAALSTLGAGDWLEGRVAYNPLAELAAYPLGKYLFLALRLVGLVLIVPVIEEFFLRGFLMRFVIDETWWRVPFGTLTRTAVAVGTLYGPLTHPAELLAAIAWFSLITWLMSRTRNPWDCVAAHSVTNALLAAYVLTFSAWHLW